MMVKVFVNGNMPYKYRHRNGKMPYKYRHRLVIYDETSTVI
jgi:hypothetical protein